MQPLTRSQPSVGWKIYFAVMALLTIVSLPSVGSQWIAWLAMAINAVALVGLFGYAWHVRLPGPQLFWRCVSLATAIVMLASMMMVAIKAGPHAQPIPLAMAVVFVFVFSIPTTYAIYKYSK